MQNRILEFIHEEKGATSAEYAILASLIAVVIIVSVTFLGLATNDLFEEAKQDFEKL